MKAKSFWENNSHFFLVLIMIFMLGGCVSKNPRPSIMSSLPERYNLPSIKYPESQAQEGAIYSENSKNLYLDRRAREIGDIVLVKIVESSSGSKKAETTTERQSTVTGDLTSLFGLEKWFSDKNVNFTPSSNSLQAGLKNDFEGLGETKRDSNVTATLSARVVDVTMNGNLVIRGYREVRVNNETQYIILSGIVRTEDISQDNSILSSYIADARIDYSGTGVLNDKQQPGWLARGLDVLWPF